MLIERLAERLSPSYRMGVIEGDIETERDADMNSPSSPISLKSLKKRPRKIKPKKITWVKLQARALSGVVSEFLQTAFDIYKKDFQILCFC